jgi:hypothetical protein
MEVGLSCAMCFAAVSCSKSEPATTGPAANGGMRGGADTTPPMIMNAPAAHGGSGGTPASPAAMSRGGAGASETRAGAGGEAGSSASAANDGADAGPSATGSMSSGGSGLFPPVSDFLADGAFGSTELDMTGPNQNYTVWMPMMPPPAGAKFPLVGWMSGGGTTPALYPLLPHLATHGFVVVASNTAPGIGDEVNLGQEIITGIDWALAENMRDGSMLSGKIDSTKIGSMGYSMGSLATFTIANDPRLTTTVHISGGNMEADRVNNLHAPAAFICGIPDPSCSDILSTDCDIAAANCDTDFMNAKTPVFYANFKGGHLGILTDPNMGPITSLATAWLRWKLMSDDTLTSMFVGDQCGACQDSTWKVQQKGL